MSSCLCSCPNVLQSPHIEYHGSFYSQACASLLLSNLVKHIVNVLFPNAETLKFTLPCPFSGKSPLDSQKCCLESTITAATSSQLCGVTRAQESLAIVPTLTHSDGQYLSDPHLTAFYPYTLSWSPTGLTVQPLFCVCPLAAAICGCYLPMQPLCWRSQAERQGYL